MVKKSCINFENSPKAKYSQISFDELNQVVGCRGRVKGLGRNKLQFRWFDCDTITTQSDFISDLAEGGSPLEVMT